MKRLWRKLKNKKLLMNVTLAGVLLFMAYNIPGMTAILGDYLTILVLVALLSPMILSGRN